MTARRDSSVSAPTAAPRRRSRGLPADQPDVVLMDINLGGMNGIECVERLKAEVSTMQFLMLTVYEDTDQIFKALAAGASGYLLKRSSPTKLLSAIREVHSGGSPMSSSLRAKWWRHFKNRSRPARSKPIFHPARRWFWTVWPRGLTYKQIARPTGHQH